MQSENTPGSEGKENRFPEKEIQSSADWTGESDRRTAGIRPMGSGETERTGRDCGREKDSSRRTRARCGGEAKRPGTSSRMGSAENMRRAETPAVEAEMGTEVEREAGMEVEAEAGAAEAWEVDAEGR